MVKLVLRLKQLTFLSFLLGGVVLLVYLMIFTPFWVYVMETLNLPRIPNITCDHCTNLTFRYLINNQSACDQQQVSLLLNLLRIFPFQGLS